MAISSNIQCLIEALAKHYREESMIDPLDVYRNAKAKLKELVKEGKVEIYQGDDTYYHYRWTDGRIGTKNLECKDFIIPLKPVSCNKQGYIYLPAGLDENNTEKYRKRYSIIYDMCVPQPLGIGHECVNLVRQLNRTGHKVWKGVLSFKRVPKEPIIDKLGQQLYNQETKWLQDVVSQIDESETFYYGHQFDKRGRIYPRQYPITYQGDEWTKASDLLDLPQIKLTENGKKWFKHDIANHYGLDKALYSERESFVDDLFNKSRSDIGTPDKPILFERAIKFYQQAINTDTTNFSVCIDATASGLQILSIMSNCAETGLHTNLTDISKCYDIYARAAQRVIDETGTTLPLKQIRKIVKKPVMTGTYNSQKQSVVAADKLKELGCNISADKLLEICECSEKIRNVKNHFKSCFKKFGELKDIKDNTIIRYMMPDGFIVELPITVKDRVRIRDDEIGYNCVMMFEKRGYNFDDGWRSFLPNVIHSIDSYICREVLRRNHYYNKNDKTFKSFDIASIHDCFIVHPNYTGIVRRNYLTVLKELQDLDILNYILNQIHPSFIYDNGLKDKKEFDIVIDENSYALC